MALADEDTNSILIDNVNRAIQGNVAMQVMQPGDQCKLCHLVILLNANRQSKANVAMQVTQPGGQICN